VPRLDPPRRIDAYDLDDALFIGSPAEANRRFQWVKREAQRCIEYLRRARLVIAGNAYLADRAASHSRRIEVVPSCVDPTAQPLREHGADEVVRIGWIGSRTTSEYVRPLLPIVETLNRRSLPVRLVLIGADPEISGEFVEHRPWRLETQASELARLDVGLMPLPDTEWTRGKCGYKILQYYAAGIPAVASPVGVNARLLDGGHGLPASTPEQWRAALEQLVGDVAERRERGAAARAFVEREYSYERWAPEVAGLLRSLS
jgi:glycosyltransferase involved in cell wall biosynthesis